MNRSLIDTPADPAVDRAYRAERRGLTPVAALRAQPCAGCGVLIPLDGLAPWCGSCGDALGAFYRAARAGQDARITSPWIRRALDNRERVMRPYARGRDLSHDPDCQGTAQAVPCLD